MEAGGAGWGEQGGEGAPPHLPSRVWVSAGCHRPPGQPVPSTGQGRGGGGEGAFLGCLGAESPPATAATRTRRDTPRPHTYTRTACARSRAHEDTRVAGYGHTQRPERADPRRAVPRVGTRHVWEHAVTQADTQQHPPSVCAHTCARTYGFGGGAGTCPSQPPPAQHRASSSCDQRTWGPPPAPRFWVMEAGGLEGGGPEPVAGACGRASPGLRHRADAPSLPVGPAAINSPSHAPSAARTVHCDGGEAPAPCPPCHRVPEAKWPHASPENLSGDRGVARWWWHCATWQGLGWQGQRGRHENSSRSS